MFIFEEYLKRTSCENFPVVYADNAVVFINRNGFELLKINKTTSSTRPGVFIVSRLRPNNYSFSEEIDWENYENYIIENYQSTGGAAEHPEDIFILGWQFFLISNQSYFCKKIGYNITYDTIDLSISPQQRIININKIIKIIEADNSIKNIWSEIFNYTQNYSYWLARIINEKKSN